MKCDNISKAKRVSTRRKQTGLNVLGGLYTASIAFRNEVIKGSLKTKQMKIMSVSSFRSNNQL